MPRSTSKNFCCQCPCPHSEPQPPPAASGDPPTLAGFSLGEGIRSNVGVPSRWWRSKTWRSPSTPQIHQTTSTCGTTPTEHLLNAGRRPQTSQKGLDALARCQDLEPSSGHWTPETSWSHIISNGKSSPRDPHLNAKTQLHSMTSKLQCLTPYTKQLA